MSVTTILQWTDGHAICVKDSVTEQETSTLRAFDWSDFNQLRIPVPFDI
jgi:hypothetical protein